MKKAYIIPQTQTTNIKLSNSLLGASSAPEVGIGDGKESEFDVKGNSFFALPWDEAELDDED